MSGDHHGRTARRATLLVTATDDILGTHKRWKTLQHVTASPSEIGPIARAALVLTLFEHQEAHVKVTEKT
jgi:hypothetical protein